MPSVPTVVQLVLRTKATNLSKYLPRHFGRQLLWTSHPKLAWMSVRRAGRKLGDPVRNRCWNPEYGHLQESTRICLSSDSALAAVPPKQPKTHWIRGVPPWGCPASWPVSCCFLGQNNVERLANL